MVLRSRTERAIWTPYVEVTMPPFKSDYDDGGLLSTIREIALAVRPGDPENLRQAQLDASAPGAGYGDLPAADQISRRLPGDGRDYWHTLELPRSRRRRSTSSKRR